MDRRGFLGAISAFAAAATSGVRMPSGVEAAAATSTLAAPTPPQPPAAPLADKPATIAHGRNALSLQDELIEELKGWSVVSLASDYCLDVPTLVRVEYRNRGPSIRTPEGMAAIIGNRRPVSISVSYESVDISCSFDTVTKYAIGECTVTVEYA
jgi:hypothetical protein